MGHNCWWPMLVLRCYLKIIRNLYWIWHQNVFHDSNIQVESYPHSGMGLVPFCQVALKKEWRHGSECRHDSTWNISVTESSTLYWHIMILVIDWNVINMQNVFTDILHFSPTGKNDNRMTNITVTVWKDDKLFPHIRGLIVRIDSFVTDRVTSVWLLYDHSMMAMSDFALLMV